MAIEYLGLSEINGPLVVLEGVKNGIPPCDFLLFAPGNILFS